VLLVEEIQRFERLKYWQLQDVDNINCCYFVFANRMTQDFAYVL